MRDFRRIELRSRDKELVNKKTIFHAMELIAASDNSVSKAELSILKDVAPSVGIKPEELRPRLKRLRGDLFKL